MIVTVKCSHCGREFSKKFEDEKVLRVLLHGELVQDVFPELSADDRELFFISQICGDCWDEIFDEDIENKIELSAEEFADSK